MGGRALARRADPEGAEALLDILLALLSSAAATLQSAVAVPATPAQLRRASFLTAASAAEAVAVLDEAVTSPRQAVDGARTAAEQVLAMLCQVRATRLQEGGAGHAPRALTEARHCSVGTPANERDV